MNLARPAYILSLTQTAGGRSTVPHTHVDTSSAVRQLAAGLFDEGRDRPWVVVSSRFGDARPAMDVEALADQVGDVCRIFTIETGDLTFELSALLPERLQVYGGAGRSYPVGFTWSTSTSATRLRFPNGDASAATAQLVNDVLTHAQLAGLFNRAPTRSQRAAGDVSGFIADSTRAIVTLDGGAGVATIWAELTYPPVPLHWTLRPGQRIEGVLDLDTRRFNVAGTAPTLEQLRERFPHLCVTLALVQSTGDASALLALHPAVVVRITRHDLSPNPLDRVSALLSEGDVVPARVIHLSTGELHVRLDDVDDDEPITPPVALVADGPSWLIEGRSLRASTESDAPDTIYLDAPGVDAAAVVANAVPMPPVTVMPDREPTSAPAPAGTPPAAPRHARSGAAFRPMPGPGLRRALLPPDGAARAATTVPATTVSETTVPETTVQGISAPARPVPATPLPEPQRALPLHRGAALQSAQLSLAESRQRIAALEDRLAASGASDSALARLREEARVAQLRAREALAELGDEKRATRALKDEQRELKSQLFRARKASVATTPADPYRMRREQWLDEVDWVRHEIYLAWVDRVAPGERDDRALPDYRVGPGFAASLSSFDTAQLAKAFKATVDVLTGLAKDMPGRAVHPLRSGDGAGASDVIRADGARCMRAYIEQHTPAARRLHYWMLPGGAIELGRVVLHDDVNP